MKYENIEKTGNVMYIPGGGTVGQRMRYKGKEEAYEEMINNPTEETQNEYIYTH